METPSEKEIARKEQPTEVSGLFEHSAASDLDFTPILHGKTPKITVLNLYFCVKFSANS